jgi:hypothetical protein
MCGAIGTVLYQIIKFFLNIITYSSFIVFMLGEAKG